MNRRNDLPRTKAAALPSQGSRFIKQARSRVAMTMIEDGTLSLDQRQSERLTEDVGNLDCLLVEAVG